MTKRMNRQEYVSYSRDMRSKQDDWIVGKLNAHESGYWKNNISQKIRDLAIL